MKLKLFDLAIYTVPEDNSFDFDLGVSEDYRNAALKHGYSLPHIFVSLALNFIRTYCEKSFISFEDEVKKTIEDKELNYESVEET